MSNIIKISSVGDISFINQTLENSEKIFQEISPYFMDADLGIANLEGPLTKKGNPVPGKCNLKGDPQWAAELKKNGINFVSLANNHMMDYGPEGLFNTIQILEKVGIEYVGAGVNAKEACKAKTVQLKGKNITLLGRTSVVVSSPSYADDSNPGVALFDIDQTLEQIYFYNKRRDIIILLMHWGLEHYFYPSKEQKMIAKRLIESGVNILIGHHPHVLQGFEHFQNSLIAYSLGNFLFKDFNWIYNAPGEDPKILNTTLSKENRESIILNLEIKDDSKIDMKMIPVFINNDKGISIDESRNRINRLNRLTKNIQLPNYEFLWKIYALKKEWDIRIKPMLSLKNILKKLLKLRIRHIKELLQQMKRSSKVASGKSSNPYE